MNYLKRIDERLHLSKEDVAYEVLGFDSYPLDTQCQKKIGHIIPSNIDDMIVNLTHHYILHISKQLLKFYKLYDKNDAADMQQIYQQNKQKIESYQFINYNEYLNIFKKNFEPKELHQYIKDYPYYNRDLDKFLFKYTQDIQGYYKLLKKQNYPIVDFLNKPLDLFLDTKYLEHGSYISGRAGSGKTELMKILIHNIISQNNSSIVIIDINGDFTTEIAQVLDDRDINRLVYIDLFLGKDKNIMPSINPFEIKSKDEQVIGIATENILNTIMMVIGEKEFTNVMRALLAPAINTLLHLEGSTLYDLYLFMDDRVNKPLLDYGIEHTKGLYSHYLANDFLEKDKSRTKAAIKTRLQIMLNFDTFSDFLTNPSTLNLEEAMNGNKIIIFKFNKILMRESASEICRFLMSSIQTIAMKRFNTDKNSRTLTHCFLDEFQNFTSSDLSEILSESRKYRLFLHLAHQYIGQIESSHLRGSIMTNCELKFSGMNSNAHNSLMAKELNIDVKKLSGLNKIGQFYLKRHTADAFKFQVSSNLVDKKVTSSQKRRWNDILESQLSMYYKEIDKDRDIFVKVPNQNNSSFEEPIKTKVKQQSHYSKNQTNSLNSLLDSFNDDILDY